MCGCDNIATYWTRLETAGLGDAATVCHGVNGRDGSAITGGKSARGCGWKIAEDKSGGLWDGNSSRRNGWHGGYDAALIAVVEVQKVSEWVSVDATLCISGYRAFYEEQHIVNSCEQVVAVLKRHLQPFVDIAHTPYGRAAFTDSEAASNATAASTQEAECPLQGFFADAGKHQCQHIVIIAAIVDGHCNILFDHSFFTTIKCYLS